MLIMIIMTKITIMVIVIMMMTIAVICSQVGRLVGSSVTQELVF